MSANRPRKLAITLRRSVIGYPCEKRDVVRSLGLRRIRHTVVRADTPQTRGMIAKIFHLIDVKEV
ncbi:MAG TPA: 50S ribosomal protein L30 [Nitrospiria bacterium]|nr:50S ribosomal protein L30 [Nitrospiria bacterium]